MTAAKPRPDPCPSCPYRRDVPSGVWSADEYEKLPPYDAETHDQPPSVFFCHQRDDTVCAGWLGCHDKRTLFGLRIAALIGAVDYMACMDHHTDVPLFASGAEAAEHGMRDVEHPGPEAIRLVTALERKLERRGGSEIC